MKERVNKIFAMYFHIQKSRPITEIPILHTMEQTRQSLGKVAFIIRSYVEIFYIEFMWWFESITEK